MPEGGRDALRRWAAPVALLVLLTIAVVLIHNGLSGGSSSSATPPAASTATRTRPAPQRSQTTTAGATATTAPASAQFYVVQSGDTFGSIAARYGTSVTQIEALNPGVSSTSLTVGQRIRVK